MSVDNFLGDVFSGNFSNAWKRLQDWWTSLKPEEQAFVARLESDAGALLKSLASVALNDVVAGGFTTASFVTAAKDVVAKGAAQGQTLLMTDAVAELNILAAPLNPVNKVVAPTPAVPPAA